DSAAKRHNANIEQEVVHQWPLFDFLTLDRTDGQGVSTEFKKRATHHNLATVGAETTRPELQAMPRASNELSRDVICPQHCPFMRTDAGPDLELLSRSPQYIGAVSDLGAMKHGFREIVDRDRMMAGERRELNVVADDIRVEEI